MSADFIFLALGVSLPVAAIGWMAGAMLDRAESSPDLRNFLWEAAFWAAPLSAIAVLASSWLPIARMPAVLRTSLNIHPMTHPTNTAIEPKGLSLTLIVLGVGLAGALWRLAWLAIRLRRLRDIQARAIDSRSVLASLPVRVSVDIASPLLAGLLHPVVLLPVGFATPQAAQAAVLICRHEAAHAKRRDNLRVLFEEVALAILWFNPLLPVVRLRLSAAREEVCDAIAVASLDVEERQLYARSLLDCLHARPTVFPATGLFGLNRRSTAMRIEAILNSKSYRPRTALTAGLLAGLALTATAAVALAASQTPTPEKTTAKWGPLIMEANQVKLDRSHHISIWSGNATVSGITKATMDGLFIDGRPANEADLSKLSETQFATITATFSSDGHELVRLDAWTGSN